MEKIVRIDNMGRIKIPSTLLDELDLKEKDNIIIEVDNGTIFLNKKD